MIAWLAMAALAAEPSWQEVQVVGAADASTTITYASFDRGRIAAYAECATELVARRPELAVRFVWAPVEQYWPLLDVAAAQGGVDVAALDLQHVPDLVAAERLVDLKPHVQGGSLDAKLPVGRLENLWGRAGHLWAIPRDWRPLALAYDVSALEQARVSVAELRSATLASHGASFSNIISRLAHDASGGSGGSASFDAQRVERYGLALHNPKGGAPFGLKEWSWMAVANGYRPTEHLYAREIPYTDPALVEALDFTAKHIARGLVAPLGRPGVQRLIDGSAALLVVSASDVPALIESGREVGYVPLPVGSAGQFTLVDGTGDAVLAQTTDVDASWAWVVTAASVNCHLKLGDAGALFPAMKSGILRSVAVHSEAGHDLSAFVEGAGERRMVMSPVTDHMAAIRALAEASIQRILGGEASAEDELRALQDAVDGVFWDATAHVAPASVP